MRGRTADGLRTPFLDRRSDGNAGEWGPVVGREAGISPSLSWRWAVAFAVLAIVLMSF